MRVYREPKRYYTWYNEINDKREDKFNTLEDAHNYFIANTTKRPNPKQQKKHWRKGYYWDKSKNKWLVSDYDNGKSKHIGRYATEEEAKIAAEKFVRKT